MQDHAHTLIISLQKLAVKPVSWERAASFTMFVSTKWAVLSPHLTARADKHCCARDAGCFFKASLTPTFSLITPLPLPLSPIPSCSLARSLSFPSPFFLLRLSVGTGSTLPHSNWLGIHQSGVRKGHGDCICKALLHINEQELWL